MLQKNKINSQKNFPYDSNQTCAEAVISSLSCLVKENNASVGSFSQGSIKPAPLGKNNPEAIASNVCLKASPGVKGSPALEITFSHNNSTAY